MSYNNKPIAQRHSEVEVVKVYSICPSRIHLFLHLHKLSHVNLKHALSFRMDDGTPDLCPFASCGEAYIYIWRDYDLAESFCLSSVASPGSCDFS